MKFEVDAFIFDLGGTLIEYEGLPHYWGDFYKDAFKNLDSSLSLGLNPTQIQLGIDILIQYNPRIYPREVEYSANHIFTEILQAWGNQLSTEEIANQFYQYFQRKIKVFQETYEVLNWIKEQVYPIGILTDLPTGMPSELAYQDIGSFSNKIDQMLTSAEVGFRKPNGRGLKMLAKNFRTSPQKIVFIGDEEKDIQTGKNAGAISILLNRKKANICYGEYAQIATLLDLKALLK